MDKLEFVSYNGKYPILCSGDLVLSLDGKNISFPSHCLSSNGSVYFDDEWNDYVEHGDWSIEYWPEGFPEQLKEIALALVNENVPHGCCGGCV